MLIKKPSAIKPSEITDRSVYMNRRKFMQTTSGFLMAGVAGLVSAKSSKQQQGFGRAKLDFQTSPAYSTNEEQGQQGRAQIVTDSQRSSQLFLE